MNVKAKDFIVALKELQKEFPQDTSKYFAGNDPKNKLLNIKIGCIFDLAKQCIAMELAEIEKLLDNVFYEIRMGAVSIMDFQARDKKTSSLQKEQLYHLYVNKHDRINNWDLVNRAAPYVVGGYLFDKDRKPLYKLAKSKNEWERRTAIVATYYFIRLNQIEDTFAIAETLIKDKNEYIQKAVGSWIREAGKKNEKKLIGFLEKNINSIASITLRYATEKLDKPEKIRLKQLKNYN